MLTMDSNHGGRQLDGIPATLDALPECVAAAEGRIRIHVDGGIRTGMDIFKALALGAECCWVGDDVPYSLANRKPVLTCMFDDLGWKASHMGSCGKRRATLSASGDTC